jgi:hypothetical protein
MNVKKSRIMKMVSAVTINHLARSKYAADAVFWKSCCSPDLSASLSEILARTNAVAKGSSAVESKVH